MTFPHPKFLDEPRNICYRILFGVWGIVAIYAILHDQYIVAIAPEHFTIYHKPIPGITSPRLLAFLLAFGASISPGLAFGMACVFCGRAGHLPKIKVRTIWTGTIGIVILAEIISASLGFYVFKTKQPLFPDVVYPDHSVPMLITQTIQLSCYLAAATFSGLFLIGMIFFRFKSAGP